MACKCKKVALDVGNGVTVNTIVKLCAECADKMSVQEQAALKSRRKSDIIHELSVLDQKSIRPLRAKISGTAVAADDDILADINVKIETLRAELGTLG